MLVRVVGLAQSLLSSSFIDTCIHRGLGHARSTDAAMPVLAAWSCHGTAVVDALLLLFGALLEEDLPQDIFFLFVGVVILDIVVVGLVEDTVRVVVAVGVLVTDAARLTQRQIRVHAAVAAS